MRSRVPRLPPTSLSLMIRKSSTDACVNCGLPAHSPSAQTPGAVVSRRSLTRMYRDCPTRPGCLESDAGGVGNAAHRDHDVAALDGLLTGARAHCDADFLPGSAAHLQDLGPQRKLDAVVTEDPLRLSGDVGILTAHQLRPGLDDRHPVAEATVGVPHFEADIAAAEHDQMRGEVIELERLDMGERPGRLEAGNARNCRMRPPMASPDCRATARRACRGARRLARGASGRR